MTRPPTTLSALRLGSARRLTRGTIGLKNELSGVGKQPDA